MFAKNLLVLFGVVFVAQLAEAADVVVRTKTGIYRGYTIDYERDDLCDLIDFNAHNETNHVTVNDSHVTVNVFRSIRYGKAPLGQQRFRPPRPVEPQFDTVQPATEFGAACKTFLVSWDERKKKSVDKTKTSEDCLFLNVWAPSNATKLPVFVFIHGGGLTLFTASSEGMSGLHIAARGQVVVVTLNYRLAAFGFLFAGTEEAPGNVGYMDQRLALAWVRDNIEFFGGDPDSVTVGGESAGSWSTGAHVISPMSANLFRRAVLMSGAPSLDFVTRSQGFALNHTMQIGSEANCTGTLEEVVTCLKEVDADVLAKIGWRLGDAFGVYNTSFLPLKPSKALKAGRVNPLEGVLFGVVKNEGSAFVLGEFGNDFNPFLNTTLTLNKTKNYIRKAMEFFRDDAVLESVDEIVEFYTESLKDGDGDKLRLAVSDAYGDYLLACPTLLFGFLLVTNSKPNSEPNSGPNSEPNSGPDSGPNSGPDSELNYGPNSGPSRALPNAWAYEFDYINGATESFGCAGWMAPCHGNDVPMLFGEPNGRFPPDRPWTDTDRAFSSDFIQIVTDFVKFGNLTDIKGVPWTDAVKNNNSVDLMQLDYNDYRMAKNQYGKNCFGLWQAVYDKD